MSSTPALRARGSRRRVCGALVAVCLIPAIGLSGCSQSSSNDGATDTTYTTFDKAQRKHITSLTGTTLVASGTGARLTVSLTGRVSVVNVWASWCAPCRKEAPQLAAAAKNPAARFVGVNIHDTQAAAVAFTRTHAQGYPTLFDADGALSLALAKVASVRSIPTTLVLDRTGGVATVFYGPVTTITLNNAISDAQH